MNLQCLVYGLKTYYQNAEEAERIILNYAVAAACGVAVSGTLPVLALPAMILSCGGTVWAMYVHLCRHLDIPIGENLLRVLAVAALSNIASNLAGVFAAEIVTAVVPGIGAAAGAAAVFGCVYLAGLMFLKLVLALAENGLVGRALGTMTRRQLKEELGRQTPSKEEAKAAKNAFACEYSK